jgi:hypothetical protein
MSWSFPKEFEKKRNEEDYNRFQTAIGNALTKKKILFGALRDEGQIPDWQAYHPAGIDHVIRIGSSTNMGRIADFNSDKSIDFALPGVQVLNELDPSKGHITGSSIATAIAAGLAATVIYCADLAEKLGVKILKSPRDYANMVMAFKRMCPEGDPKCPLPSRIPIFQEFPMNSSRDGNEQKEALKVIVTKLGFCDASVEE